MYANPDVNSVTLRDSGNNIPRILSAEGYKQAPLIFGLGVKARRMISAFASSGMKYYPVASESVVADESYIGYTQVLDWRLSAEGILTYAQEGLIETFPFIENHQKLMKLLRPAGLIGRNKIFTL